jgi:hypothetical protein
VSKRAKIILLITIWLKRFREQRLADLFSRQSQLPDPFYADLFFHGLTKSTFEITPASTGVISKINLEDFHFNPAALPAASNSGVQI